ncbi:NAD(P)/FAD-dependent oxidoreductase [Marinobacter bryozoorum]|uniref:flavin-containing monooxygenase n=1 Tax=Marinobacter bryozoorum TaxID=256324 RepID=UPI00200667DA|nr:NAD(P)/FAD-dependent oxidoreductase [Marinobacter bryozoorum]MCK7543514.1 NAD(P)/FAD-dependent oxidoreductase [Marinobacter bryozoorum]
MTTTTAQDKQNKPADVDYDVVIIGAGFAGMYQLHKLRQIGLSAHIFETGDDVGGTWYWNRYPGARVDIESMEYSYSFDDKLQQEWRWKERFAPQPELLEYARHVCERYDLRRDISFSTRVNKLAWDDRARTWTVTTSGGKATAARYVIAATGCLSKPSDPRFEGMESFKGEMYWTSNYPREGVDLSGKKVAVIGTGSSGIQTITTIAPQAGHLTVFQRTPTFAVPAHNTRISDERDAEIKANYAEIRRLGRETSVGFNQPPGNVMFADVSPEEARKDLDERWARGGLGFSFGFEDVLFEPVANEFVAEYVRNRIREKVKDPQTAELLCPTSYPIASKRMCVDTGYFETYNRDNVDLVDLQAEPLKRITETGIRVGNREIDFDVIIFATGFDAMTGALNSIEINNGNQTLSDKWRHGPQTYLGLMSHGFPNLFMITGPQSPSVLSNMMVSIEDHVDWVSEALRDLKESGRTRIEPAPDAEENWVHTTNDLANLTLMPQANSWYMGANIPGKERVFMPFVGGVDTYAQIIHGVRVANYHGFEFA